MMSERPTLSFQTARRMVAGAMLAAILTGLIGCQKAPRVVTLSSLRDDSVARELAPQYWKKVDLPDFEGESQGRLVISGFAVEFITAKKEGFFKRQPIATAPPISPFGVGVELSGLGRKRILFGDSMQLDVVDSLHDQLIEMLEDEHGYEIVPHEDVLASESYQQFQFRTADSTEGRGVFQQVNLIASDTGTVKAAQLRPASGYQLIADTMDSVAVRDVKRSLAQELGAETAVHVRLRVGVYRGLAALEQGSRIEMTILPIDDQDPTTGVLTMRRSMLSEESVSMFDSFVPLQGERREVVDDVYVDSISEIFEVSLDLLKLVLRGSSLQPADNG